MITQFVSYKVTLIDDGKFGYRIIQLKNVKEWQKNHHFTTTDEMTTLGEKKSVQAKTKQNINEKIIRESCNNFIIRDQGVTT